jgi:C4-dicarboxylate-specific signal transduction histidine kinase
MMRISVGEIDSISITQAQLEQRSADLTRVHLELEELNASLEDKVAIRARELEASQETISRQQHELVSAGKLVALGEMAGGIAHEINNPLSIIALRVERLESVLKSAKFDPADFANGLSVINRTVDRIAKIVSGLKFFAREGSRSVPQVVMLFSLVEETLGFCRERFKNHGVELRVIDDEAFKIADLECQNVEISQVLLNLLNNSFDAVSSIEPKWIQIQVRCDSEYVQIEVSDSGTGIRSELREKIMQPFFTTKGIGKGTGLGLSISKGIAERHSGSLTLAEPQLPTCFILRLPRRQPKSKGEAAA